jgi:hypothetical protein
MIAWLWPILLSLAQAGFLQMESAPDLKLETRQGKLFLVGRYAIENRGDETALQVFPEVQLDGFSWSGEPRRLEAGARSEWLLNEELRGLCAKGKTQCPSELPLKGQFLFKIDKHYSDLNSYPFAVPDVLALSNAPTEQVIEIQMDPPVLSDRVYSISYKLKNLVDQELKVSLEPHVPRELSLLTPALLVEIPSQGEVLSSFQVENVKGLPGSRYFLYLTAVVARNGLRTNAWSTIELEISPAPPAFRWNPDQAFGIGLLGGLILGLFGMWWFWSRPRQRLR